MREDALRQKIRSMTETEIFNAIYKDTVTGVLNRSAFQCGYSQMLAIVDADSLKWVNDNWGHPVGDQMLRALAQALEKEFPGKVYRLSGDEFAVRGNDATVIIAKLRKAQMEFPHFSYGIGRDLKDADDNLKFSKDYRESRGLRSPRGERPPGLEFREIA